MTPPTWWRCGDPGQAVLNALAGTLDVGIPYPLQTSSSMPAQESTPARPNVP